MGDKKDLTRRLVFAAPMVVVGVGALVNQTSSLIFVLALWVAFFFEITSRLNEAEGIPPAAYALTFAFLLVGSAGFIAAVSLRFQDDGFWTVVLIAAGAVVTDSGAYLVGKKRGHTQMSPKISPNKTQEGLIAGLMWGMVTLYVGITVLEGFDRIELGRLTEFLVVVLLPFAAVAGDLFASKVKRVLDIKDFSDVFGPHGGFVDRLDSIVAAFLMYWAIVTIV